LNEEKMKECFVTVLGSSDCFSFSSHHHHEKGGRERLTGRWKLQCVFFLN